MREPFPGADPARPPNNVEVDLVWLSAHDAIERASKIIGRAQNAIAARRVELPSSTRDEDVAKLVLVHWDNLVVPKFGSTKKSPQPPIPMRLPCPSCGKLHVDVGDFATKPHHTHACQFCGMVWRPAVVDTVGVQFLPGYKNDET